MVACDTFLRYRKKRKWDVPGAVPAPIAGLAPSILGPPFVSGPVGVPGGAPNPFLQSYPQLAAVQAAPMGVPGSSAAEEIRKKINQVGVVASRTRRWCGYRNVAHASAGECCIHHCQWPHAQRRHVLQALPQLSIVTPPSVANPLA